SGLASSPCGTRPCVRCPSRSFFFTATAPPAIYTLSLHDALPIFFAVQGGPVPGAAGTEAHSPRRSVLYRSDGKGRFTDVTAGSRSEEHTSELQSRGQLVCRLLLEKKKN